MNRDDRLFVIIGGTVVTAAATFFLAFAGGMTGSVEERPTVRVAPISAATAPDGPALRGLSEATATTGSPAGVTRAVSHDPTTAIGGDVVRSVMAGISAHPQWMSWVVTDDLLSRFVLAVEAVADGYSPTDELGFIATRSPFIVREDDGRLVIAAGTFRRYNLAVDVFASVDAAGAVAVVRELEPEIAEIRRDLVWHRGDFEDRLRAAIDHLLEVEIPEGAIEVERRTTTYAFADDGIEHLSGAQRQLLRMGRKNATTVQAKLREIRSAFGWPVAPSPAETSLAVLTGEDAEAPEPALVAEAVEVDPRAEDFSEISASALVVDPGMSVVESPVRDVSPPAVAADDVVAAPTE
jgi:hypothetical protein